MNKKKHLLVLGGSSDIGSEVIKSFLNLKWDVTAHFNKNSKKLKILQKKTKNLKLVKFNFANYNLSTEKLILKKFNKKYDSIINLICYLDNKSFDKTNLKNILKSLRHDVQVFYDDHLQFDYDHHDWFINYKEWKVVD